MEYVDGRTLREVLREYARLPAAEAARIAAEIADALVVRAPQRRRAPRHQARQRAAHRRPAQVKVTDFGIARAEQSDDLTKTGSVMGTATYFSPEQAQGLDLDGRADVYALGVVLYEMLTGVAPFIADNPVSVAYKHVREEPVPPSRVNPEVPEAMDRVVLTAMAEGPRPPLPVGRRPPRRPAPLRTWTAASSVARSCPPVTPGRRRPSAAATAAATRSRPQPARRETPLGRGRSPSAIAFVLLIALIAVLLVQSDFGETTAAGPKADVPPVIGQQYAQAEATLTGLQFKVVRADADSDQAADQVLDQNPEAGSRVGKGSTVTLTVSSATIAMPDIIGKTQQEARGDHAGQAPEAVLHRTGLATRPRAPSSRRFPTAGAKIPKPPPGAADPVITVFVAQEPPVAIPDVKGQDPTAATSVLNQAGFLTVTRTDTPSDTIPVGQVIGTDPPAGTPTPKTATDQAARVDRAERDRGAERGRADAGRRRLAAARAWASTSRSSRSPSTAANKGKVISQSPPAGTKLKKLDSVTITVGI